MEVPSCARHLPPTYTQADAARGGGPCATPLAFVHSTQRGDRGSLDAASVLYTSELCIEDRSSNLSYTLTAVQGYCSTVVVRHAFLGVVLEPISSSAFTVSSKRHEARGAAPGPRSLRRAFLFSFVFSCVVFPLCGVNILFWVRQAFLRGGNTW